MRKAVAGLAVVGALIVVTISAAAAAAGIIPGPWSDRSDTARVGTAQPQPGKVRVDSQPGQITPAQDWPDACNLLSDSDIMAILPDATELGAENGGVSTTTIEEYATKPEWREDENTTKGRCVWHMRLPGERTNAFTFLWVRIVAVADPDLIRRYHEDEGVSRGAGLAANPLTGGGSCYLSGLYNAHLVCASGPLMYEVGGSTTTDFGDYRAYSHWRDTVLPQFATTVATRIRTS